MPGTIRVAHPCGCRQEHFNGQKRPKLCEHRNLFEKPGTGSQRPRRRAELKRGRGFATSKAQQDKVRNLPCVVCGLDRHETEIHPAHVCPRRLASCECAEGVVPLCSKHHRLYDDKRLDLLPHLVNRGYRAELVHAVVAHDAPIRELLQQVTGVRWEPVSESARAEGVAA